MEAALEKERERVLESDAALDVKKAYIKSWPPPLI